jgi:GDP-D-mannose dehydratase
MIERNSIDTICHEHLEYYAIRQIKTIMDRANFQILDISLNECNGGSMRVVVAKRTSSKYKEATQLVEQLIEKETKYDLSSPNCYYDFMKRCKTEMKYLVDFIDTVNNNGKEVWIYGASTKGNCLLQCANLDTSKIRYAVERNLQKVGKMTSTGIEIISEETMRKNPPAYLLVLPWHFRNEILQRETEFLSNGGQFLFPFPHFEVVSAKPTALITGWNGQIAHYVKETLKDSHTLYGLDTVKGVSNGICFDRSFPLEQLIVSLKPSVVIHLAGVSNSEEAKQNVVRTLELNGLFCARLCEYIHTHKLSTKLINASSSEIYKDHITYTITENDTHYNHLHPYSIGKILSHTIVQYYRNEYNLPFSNAILFMTESPRKKSTFLLNKIAEHARNWKESHSVLQLGSLDSQRCIQHAEDVATAFQCILEQPSGDDYVVSGLNSYNVYTIVKELYSLFSIHLEKSLEDSSILLDTLTNLPVIKIQPGFRSISTDIRGSPTKLLNLGWTHKHTLHSLLLDISKC